MDAHDDFHDDATLVTRVLAGEREQFGPLLTRHYPGVVRLCQRLLGLTHEAQDIAQEAALQAFLELPHLQEPARFGAWLHAIAANLARMALRRRRASSLDALGESVPRRLLWAARTPAPDEAVAARDVHDVIVRALNELSAVNREAVLRFYLEGYSYAELAALLDVPVSTVKGRLFQGRRQLKHALSPVADETLTPYRRPRKEQAMTGSDLVPVTIDAIRPSALMAALKTVVLREEGGERMLPIWVDAGLADAIAVALEGRQPSGTHPRRPLTHDLSLQLLESVGARIEHVVVRELTEAGIFYAEISVVHGEQRQAVDARPSDALALAVRRGLPIFVARPLWEAAAIVRQAASVEDDDPAGWTPPFVDHVWTFLLSVLLRTPGPVPREQLLTIDWSTSFATRQLEWEGQPMVAVRLPVAGEAAWLLVEPALWTQITEEGHIQAALARPEAEPAGLTLDLPLDEAASQVLSLADEEARAFNHNYLGTEHVLLGLVRQGESGAARVLTGLGLDLTRLRRNMALLLGRGLGPGVQPSAQLPLTPRLRRVFALAQDEARQRGQDMVATEHLLLGLMRGSNVAALVLANLGLLGRAREGTLALLRRGDEESTGTRGES